VTTSVRGDADTTVMVDDLAADGASGEGWW
jgi:hypothetical protein